MKILDSPLDFREINQSILREINPEYSLEGLMPYVRKGRRTKEPLDESQRGE